MKTQWMYVHSVSRASRIVIEFGGGRVATNPYTNYTLFVTLENGNGVGGLYTPNQIDELILLSYPRYFDLIFGEALSVQFDLWLNEAVAWTHQQGYTQIYGYGYSAGATVWMRYVLSDEFGHARTGNETVTGIIAKAYANQSCYECFQYASNVTLPILFLSGTNDTIAPLTGVQTFYDRISSTRKTIVTFPTDHNGMAEILPIAEQEWLLNEPITISETNSLSVIVVSSFAIIIISITLNKYRRR
jgi:hypothetical protein